MKTCALLLLSLILVGVVVSPAAAAPVPTITIVIFCPGTMSPTCPAPNFLWLGVAAFALSVIFPNPPIPPAHSYIAERCADQGATDQACLAATYQGLLK